MSMESSGHQRQGPSRDQILAELERQTGLRDLFRDPNCSKLLNYLVNSEWADHLDNYRIWRCKSWEEYLELRGMWVILQAMKPENGLKKVEERIRKAQNDLRELNLSEGREDDDE